MAPNSRRNSIDGIETEAEYSSGGSTPARIHSGSMSTAGTNGKRLTTIPAITRINGAATPIRAPSVEAATIPSRPSTTMIRASTASPCTPGFVSGSFYTFAGDGGETCQATAIRTTVNADAGHRA